MCDYTRIGVRMRNKITVQGKRDVEIIKQRRQRREFLKVLDEKLGKRDEEIDNLKKEITKLKTRNTKLEKKD